MYKPDLAVNNQQELVCHKIKPIIDVTLIATPKLVKRRTGCNGNERMTPHCPYLPH